MPSRGAPCGACHGEICDGGVCASRGARDALQRFGQSVADHDDARRHGLRSCGTWRATSAHALSARDSRGCVSCVGWRRMPRLIAAALEIGRRPKPRGAECPILKPRTGEGAQHHVAIGQSLEVLLPLERLGETMAALTARQILCASPRDLSSRMFENRRRGSCRASVAEPGKSPQVDPAEARDARTETDGLDKPSLFESPEGRTVDR